MYGSNWLVTLIAPTSLMQTLDIKLSGTFLQGDSLKFVKIYIHTEFEKKMKKQLPMFEKE